MDRNDGTMLGGGLDRRHFLGGLAALGVGISTGGLLSACGSDDGDGSPSAELTVSHWPSLMYTVPWAVAIDEGYFDDRGIELDGVIGSAGGGTTVRNVATGGLPLGVVATAAAISAYNAGAPLQIVSGANANTRELNFITLPDRGVETIQDLQGRRIGFTNPGSVAEGCAVLCLQRAGIDLDDVELIPLGGYPEAHTALREGVVDAAPHILPTYFLQEDQDWQVVFWTDEYISDFMQMVLVAGANTVSDRPELLQDLLGIYQDAVAAVIDDPERGAASWARHSDVPEAVGLESLTQVDPSQYYATRLDEEGLKTVAEQMVAIDLLDSEDDVDWEGMIDQSLLPDDLQVDLDGLG